MFVKVSGTQQTTLPGRRRTYVPIRCRPSMIDIISHRGDEKAKTLVSFSDLEGRAFMARLG